MFRTFLLLSSLSALFAVMIGAFGAHGLRASLSVEAMAIYQTGVNYHFWHALGIGLIALITLHHPDNPLLKWAGWLMFFGIVLFSGSLYLLAISGVRTFGMITPLGGTAFITAWFLVALFAYKLPKSI